MIKSGVNANEIGEYKDESMEVEDGIGVPDAFAVKSLDVSVGDLKGIRDSGNDFKITKTDAVAAKSLDVLVGSLGVAFKIAKTNAVVVKSSDVLVVGLRSGKSLGGATKSPILVTKR